MSKLTGLSRRECNHRKLRNKVWYRREMDLFMPIIILALLFCLFLQNFACSTQYKTKNKLQLRAIENGHTDNEDINVSLHRTTFFSFFKKEPIHSAPTVDTSEMYFENSHFVYRQLFNNITKIKDKNVLFSEISEDNFFTNRSFFKKQMSAHNVFSFKTLISGESICSQVRPYVLIIILSQIEHSTLREAIRRTWLKSAERNSWPRFNITKTIKHVFLFGYRQHKLLHDTQVLQKESDKYGDIVALDFIDTYKNLSLKVIHGVEWTLKYCNGVEFLLKVDEDTLINVPLMVELLTHVSRRRNNDAFVLGKIHWNPKPEVSRKGRWKVSEQMYPFPYYPLYLYGHSYAINRAALRIISVTAKRIRWVTPEDAFITGILPVFAGIQRLHAPSFTVCCRRTYDCEVIWNKNVAITSAWNAKRLKRLWAGILLNKCNPDVPFYNI